MRNTPKTLAFIIMLTPISGLATSTCSQEDSNCKTMDAQLQAIKESGAKPIGTETTGTTNNKNTTTQPVEQQPFKIPLPLGSQSTDSTPNSANDQQEDQSTKEQPINIFIPHTNTNTQNSGQPASFTLQPPKQPLQPITSQPKQ